MLGQNPLLTTCVSVALKTARDLLLVMSGCSRGTILVGKVCVGAEPSLVTTCVSVALKTADFSRLD